MVNILEDKCGTCPLFGYNTCPLSGSSHLPSQVECMPRRMWRIADKNWAEEVLDWRSAFGVLRDYIRKLRAPKEMDVPFVAFSNEELEKKPAIKKGDKILCSVCHRKHLVSAGTDADGKESDIMLFYRCGKNTYLAGIAGKRV